MGKLGFDHKSENFFEACNLKEKELFGITDDLIEFAEKSNSKSEIVEYIEQLLSCSDDVTKRIVAVYAASSIDNLLNSTALKKIIKSLTEEK